MILSDKKNLYIRKNIKLCMARIIYIKDGGLNTSTTIPPGYTALGSDIGELKKKVVDTISGVIPYKVYTALLTQSGVNEQFQILSGPLTKGVTYYFEFPAEGYWDYSNLGGPIYPDTIPFVATSNDIPNNYGYNGLFYNTGAPVVTVLENTIGNIWFLNAGGPGGNYQFRSDGLFSGTIPKFENVLQVDTGSPGYVLIFKNDNETLNINTFLSDGNTSNDLLNNTPIEIRVYN